MPAPLTPTGVEGGKKRKRTGAERERRKQAAIEAKLKAEAPETPTETLDPDVPAPADLPSEIPPLQSSGDGDVDSPAGPSRPAVDFDKLASRVPQALKTLHPVFKQARSFEVRRLVKKIKHLRTKADAQEELADLEAQLALISHLPLTPVAQSHLLIKLRKHALLKSSPLPNPIVALLSPSPDTYPPSGSDSKLVGKVENRLCSAKNVAPVVKNAVGWLVGEEGAKLVRSNTNPAQGGKVGAVAQKVSVSSRTEEAEEEEGGYEDEVEDEEGPELVIPQRRSRGQEEAEAEEEAEAVSDGEMDDDELADAAGWESGSVSGGEVGGRRAAYLSGDDLSAESDLEGLSDSDIEDSRPAKRAANIKASKSQSQPQHPAPQAKEKAPSKSKTKTVEKVDTRDITSSMFLPSLASGFTRGSDDDSDPDMDFDEGGVIGKKGVPGRKNRRGQRARQAIWEKKYGKNAKHVVKAAKDKDFAASQGQMNTSKARQWGAGAGAPARGGPPGGGSSGTVAKPAEYSGRTVSAAPAANGPSNQGAPGKAVHPSWEAAKMRKMKEAVVQPGGGPKPTKIVFD